MVKIYLKSAYRHAPLHPSNCQVTGLKYLYDTKLPFRAKWSPEIFHHLTQSITWMMSHCGFFVIAYLNDFLIISESEHECWIAFWELITLLEWLGLTVTWNKVVFRCQRLTYLVIEIDSKRRQLRLPNHKLQEIRALLSQTFAKSKFTKRQLQWLVGKLNFVAHVVLRQNIDALNMWTRPYHQKQMTNYADDILWWADFMEIFNGKTFSASTEPTWTAEFSTDASLVGSSGHYQWDSMRFYNVNGFYNVNW